MINEREMLEYAAKACEINRNDYVENGARNGSIVTGFYSNLLEEVWNPLTSSADCAAMCAKLEIHTQWWNHSVACISNSGNDKRDVKHDGTYTGKEAAWRYAATMVAAKIGGMK